MVRVGSYDFHSELCTIHWFTDCNDSTADSRIRNPLPCWLVYHVDFTRIKPTTLGKHHWNEVGRTCVGHIPCLAAAYNSVLVLGMGYPWYGSGRSVHSHFQVLFLKTLNRLVRLLFCLQNVLHQSMEALEGGLRRTVESPVMKVDRWKNSNVSSD